MTILSRTEYQNVKEGITLIHTMYSSWKIMTSRCGIKTILTCYVLLHRASVARSQFNFCFRLIEKINMVTEKLTGLVFICATLVFVGILINGVYILRHKRVITVSKTCLKRPLKK